jgi:cerevisin
MRGLIALSLPLLAAAAPSFHTGTTDRDAAPIFSSTNAEVVPDSYVVVFKKHVNEEKASNHHSWLMDLHTTRESERAELRKRGQFPITTEIFKGLKHTYNIAGDFLGYSGHFDESVIDSVRRHPDVSDIPTVFCTFVPVLT